MSMLQKCRSRQSLIKIARFQSLQSHAKLKSTFQEVRIPVPWGHVAGKWWGPTEKRPVLVLHGWQDNCGSFNRLIPLLDANTGFLAVDFPGHGYSSNIPHGLYQHSNIYLILVEYLTQYFQWPKVSLLGHSMGALTSFLYTIMYPKNVDFTICIDALKPMSIKNNFSRMAKIIPKYIRYQELEKSCGEPPSYDMDEIKQKISKPNCNSIAIEHTHHLIERNIAPSKVNPGKYYFTRDPRLKVGELVNFPHDESVEYAKHITSPIFVCKAKSASYYEDPKNFYEALDGCKVNSADCQFHHLEGTHHIHLNTPEVLAPLVRNFMEKHDIEDRSVGGIKSCMIVK